LNCSIDMPPLACFTLTVSTESATPRASVIAGDKCYRAINPTCRESSLLETESVQIINFKMSDPGRLLSYGPSVEPCAEEDDLPAAEA
jgi:hypothetical protein